MSQNEFKKYTYEWAGRPLVIEVGEYAKQANGSCMITYGQSSVLSCVCSKTTETTQDFFPLMVLYQEKLYAAGKIPGGFLRREGRPSEHETLTSRLIDRPIRPLFAEGYCDEVQIVNTVMSADPVGGQEMAAMFGSSLALMVSDIPFEGPIAGVKVGRVNGEYIINPTPEQAQLSDIDLTVAGTSDAINMVEAGAKDVSEEDMLQALMFGHAEIKRLNAFQEEVIKAIGKEKVEIELYEIPADIEKIVKDKAEQPLKDAVIIKDKLERYAKIDEINDATREHFNELWKDDEELELKQKYVDQLLEAIVADEVRRLITEEKIRPDGRKVDEIRPLSSCVDVLERTHGSAVFTRGQTQSLGIVTLGSLGEFQIIDGLGVEEGKRFMFHYNFPAFSVGEVGRYGSPGRREIGHGALAERALLQVIPSEEEFPYTIRVVSEILESNGSSSQASICAGTMSLMAAGVPIKAPVAGIAMGLITKGEHYTILTDIQGMEDHYGDMDFKVAGTRNGITALQMDIKIEGITEEILREALAQAKVGRMTILGHMLNTISTYRDEVSKYAPKVEMFRINPEKIRDVIGAGGKNITEIINDCNNVKIDIEQDGRVFVMHSEREWINKAKERIMNIVREAEVDKVYTGKVVKVVDFGAFVELWPGCEGMVHISELDEKRVKEVKDVCQEGDEIIVKVIAIDDKGKIKLSRKAVFAKTDK